MYTRLDVSSQPLNGQEVHHPFVLFGCIVLHVILGLEIEPMSKPCRTFPDSRSATTSSPAPEAPPRLLYSRKETAYLLSLSLRAIAYMIASGDLRTKRHGGRVMITHAELLRQAALDDRKPIVPKKTRQKATVTTMQATNAA